MKPARAIKVVHAGILTTVFLYSWMPSVLFGGYAIANKLPAIYSVLIVLGLGFYSLSLMAIGQTFGEKK